MRIYWFFIWTNWNPLHPRMLCAKFGWNWASGSVEEDFLILSMYFLYFVIISPWKRAGPFIWTNWNPLHPRMLCAKFSWNWPSGSGEEYFSNSSMYFHNFVIISSCISIRAWPFIWTNLNHFTQGCFVLSLVKINSVVLEKKMKMWRVYDNKDNGNSDYNDNDSQRTNFDKKSSLEPTTDVSLKIICFVFYAVAGK